MAGSRKWVVYQTDANNKYAVELDESNAIAGGFDDMTDASINLPLLPARFKMRYVNVVNGNVRRKLFLGKGSNALRNGGKVKLPLYSGSTQSTVDFTVTSYRGERRTLPYAADTGVNDGTAT